MSFLNPSQIISYLNLEGRQKDPPQIHGSWILCLCKFKHKGRKERNPSMGINLETGHFKCFACGKFGTLKDLCNLENKATPSWIKIKQLPEIERVSFTTLDSLLINRDIAKMYLQGRGITTDYPVGASKSCDSIYIPLFEHGEFVAWLERVISKNGQLHKEWIKQPRGFDFSSYLFGFDIKDFYKTVFVFESSLDKLYVDSCKLPDDMVAVSTNGSFFGDGHVDKLLHYHKIVLCSQHDKAGYEWLRNGCEKINRYRQVYFTFPPKIEGVLCKDWNEIKNFSLVQKYLAKNRLYQKMELSKI